MKLNVAFIGAGNVAWHLAPALDNIGAVVRYVYSRNPKNAQALVRRLYQGQINENLDFSDSGIDMIFLTVADDAIEAVASELRVDPGTLVVHTSGAQSIDVLDYYFDNYGVFYPLQTFSRSKAVDDFKHIPLLVEASTNKGTEVLTQVANNLSNHVQEVSSRDRLFVHLAAVFASNFSNHMLTVSKHLLERYDLDFKLLQPLISETINKALAVGPENSQTGPAKRHDLKTLDKHLALLSDNEELADMYRLISQHIIDTYHK